MNWTTTVCSLRLLPAFLPLTTRPRAMLVPLHVLKYISKMILYVTLVWTGRLDQKMINQSCTTNWPDPSYTTRSTANTVHYLRMVKQERAKHTPWEFWIVSRTLPTVSSLVRSHMCSVMLHNILKRNGLSLHLSYKSTWKTYKI